MKICIFEVFNTLDEHHIELSLQTIFPMQRKRMVWDKFIVYNTHDHISTDHVVERVKHYGSGSIAELQVLEVTPKSSNLHQDVINCLTYLKQSVHEPYSVLFLKSDYCLSSNFNQVYEWVDALPNKKWQWTLAGYTSKEWVKDEDILRRAEEGVYIPRNEYITFDCGTNPGFPLTEPMSTTLGKSNLDESVKFVAHTVISDFNAHVFGSEAVTAATTIFDRTLSPNNPRIIGGGSFFETLRSIGVKFIHLTDAYQVHMFHSVDRFYAPMKMVSGQRY